MHRELKATGHNTDSYRIALLCASGMTEALSAPWELVSTGERLWSVQLGEGLQIKLPSGDALRDGSLFFPSSLSACLAMRSRLNDHLLDYSVEDLLPPDLADLLKRGLHEASRDSEGSAAGKDEAKEDER